VILESIAIDYRCHTCCMIRRIDASPQDTVMDRLPEGWISHDHTVVCDRCSPGGRDARHERAEEKREAMKTLRSQAWRSRAEAAQVFDASPSVTDAVSPLAADRCHRCGTSIGEMESWRPDPTVTTYFAKVHRRCM